MSCKQIKLSCHIGLITLTPSHAGTPKLSDCLTGKQCKLLQKLAGLVLHCIQGRKNHWSQNLWHWVLLICFSFASVSRISWVGLSVFFFYYNYEVNHVTLHQEPYCFVNILLVQINCSWNMILWVVEIDDIFLWRFWKV